MCHAVNERAKEVFTLPTAAHFHCEKIPSIRFSAACELLFVSAVQFSLLFSGHTGLLGLGGYASPPLVSYGQLVLSVFSVYNIF